MCMAQDRGYGIAVNTDEKFDCVPGGTCLQRDLR